MFGDRAERVTLLVEPGGFRGLMFGESLASEGDAVGFEEMDNAGLAQAVPTHELDCGPALLVLGDEAIDLVMAEPPCDVANLRLRRLRMGRTVAPGPLKKRLKLIEIHLEMAWFGITSNNVNQKIKARSYDRAFVFSARSQTGPTRRGAPGAAFSGVWGSTGGTPRNSQKKARSSDRAFFAAA